MKKHKKHLFKYDDNKRDKNSFRDVYGRMSWGKPATTITTRFNSLSNGRFGHPEEDRAISLREGATLQTFPKSFVFKTKTIKEVIAEINLKFRTLITDEGVEAVGSYLEAVTQDEDIKDIIRSNKMKDPEMVYQTIIRDKMQASLQDFIMDGIGKGIYSSDLYEKITSDNVMPFINKTAYNLIRENLKAA